MLIPTHYGKRHYFTIRGQRVAEIICLNCSHPFRMEDAVGATGEGFSDLGLTDDRAKTVARMEAEEKFATSLPTLSPVPCPQCHQFHPAMNAILRWLFWQRVLFAGMAVCVALAIGAILIFANMSASDRGILAGAGALATGFLVYRYRKDLALAPVTLSSFTPAEGGPKLRIGIQMHGDTEMHWYDVNPHELEGDTVLPGMRAVGHFLWSCLMALGGILVFFGIGLTASFFVARHEGYKIVGGPPPWSALWICVGILAAGIAMMWIGSAKRKSAKARVQG